MNTKHKILPIEISVFSNEITKNPFHVADISLTIYYDGSCQFVRLGNRQPLRARRQGVW